MEIGQAIKQLRMSRQLTQIQLSELTRGLVNISTIKRLESGQEINPTWNTLEALRQALQVGLLEWFLYVHCGTHLSWEESSEPMQEWIEKIHSLGFPEGIGATLTPSSDSLN